MSFCTAINCMDGRIQLPVINFLQKRFNVSYVDMITEAGPNKILADGKDHPIIDAIIERIRISVEMHGSKSLAVIGHFDCAKNPALENEQRIHTWEAVGFLKSIFPGVEITGLWVNSSWEVVETEEAV